MGERSADYEYLILAYHVYSLYDLHDTMAYQEFHTPQVTAMAQVMFDWFRDAISTGTEEVKEIPPQVLFNYIKHHKNAGFEFIHINNLMELATKEYEPLNEERRKAVKLTAIQALTKIRYRQYVQNEVKLAEKYMGEGRYDEAITVLHSINYDKASKNQSSLSIIHKALGEPNMFLTGLKQWDNPTYGLQKGNLAMLIGASGGAKTMTAISMCLSILLENPTYNVTFFQAEMGFQDMGERLYTIITGKDPKAILAQAQMEGKSLVQVRHQMVKETQDMAMQGDPVAKAMLERFRIVLPGEFKTVYDMAKIVHDHKANFWVLDYFTLMFEGGDKDTQSSDWAKGLAEIAKLNGGNFGLVICQLQKDVLGKLQVQIPNDEQAEYTKVLKQLSRYTWSIFRPCVVDPAQPRSWLYLINWKNRGHTPVDIYINLDAAKHRMSESDRSTQTAMKEYLDEYRGSAKRSTQINRQSSNTRSVYEPDKRKIHK